MRVHTRDIKVHCAAEHVDLAVREKMRQVLLYHMGSAVVAAGKAAKQLAAAVMPPRDRLALELGAAQACQGEAEMSSLQSAHELGMSSRGGSPRRRRVTMVVQRSVKMG